MGKYSLMNVLSQNKSKIIGVWLQDFTGQLTEAHHRARSTEAANNNKIRVVVTNKTNRSTPNYDLQSIDKREIHYA